MLSLLGQKIPDVLTTAGCCKFGISMIPIREPADAGKRVALAMYMLRMFSNDTKASKGYVPLAEMLRTQGDTLKDFAVLNGGKDATTVLECESL